MISDYNVGDFVYHPDRTDWGKGQVQSVIGHRVTVNFEHAGKTVILADRIRLVLVADETELARN